MLRAGRRLQRLLAWTDSADSACPRASTPSSELIAKGPADDHEPPQRHGRIVILTSGTTGTPKGAPRNEAGIDAAVSLLSRMPLRRGWKTHIAAPLFHTWGYAHLALGMLLGSTVVLTRPLRPRGRAGGRREAPLRLAGGHPGDAPADPPAPGRHARHARPVDGQGGRRLRLRAARRPGRPPGWTASATPSTTSTARPRWPTPRWPPRVTSARRPAPPGKPPHATVVRIVDEDGKPVPTGRDRPDLRRQRTALRGLHRRRPQGHDRRADVQRRRRPLRRGRSAVRRGPRRRDDRLRRGERLPQGGRGLPGPPRRRRRRGGDRRRRRRVRQAAAGLRGHPDEGAARTTSRRG